MDENNTNLEILLVEDNPGDVRLTQEAFREAEFEVSIRSAADGIEAMSFLRDEGIPLPDIVLLDLNLPRKDGFDVMEEIRDDPKLKRLPVLVLSSSTSEEDVVSSYDKHANAYLTKPDDPESFVEMAQAVEEFWVERVRLPTCS